MRWFLKLSLIAGLVFATAVSAPAQESRVNARVPVELEWEEIPGATLYELEFQNHEGKNIGVVKSASHIFKFKFKVGNYKVRSRAADSRKVFGDWSPLQEFQVQPRPVQVSEKTVRTKGVVSSKTLLAPVLWKWEETLGALRFRVKVLNEKGEVVREEVVNNPLLKTDLPAGVYTSVITSIGADNIESDPVTLPGTITIETVQLAQPVLALEEVSDPVKPGQKVQRLPLTKGVPTFRLKGKPSAAQTVGTLEYRYFFGEEWIPVDRFQTQKSQEVVLEKAIKPGHYRLNAWSEAVGFKKSEVMTYEFVIKPTNYEE